MRSAAVSAVPDGRSRAATTTGTAEGGVWGWSASASASGRERGGRRALAADSVAVASRGCAAWRAAAAAGAGPAVRWFADHRRPLSSESTLGRRADPAGGVRRTCGQPAAMWTTAGAGRQADAAAAGALLVDDEVEDADEVDDDPESDFFGDESVEEEPLASPEPLDVDESADTFSLASGGRRLARAAVGPVEAAALEHDADRREHLAEPAARTRGSRSATRRRSDCTASNRCPQAVQAYW